MHRIDVSNDRRTAESLLAIAASEVPDVVVELVKAKRLSTVMENLNRLVLQPSEADLARRALRHLGFVAD